jgi:hypothetical protein
VASAEIVSARAQDGLPHSSERRYEGCFAPLAAQIGGGRRLTKRALVAALEAHLQQWQAQRGPITGRHGAYAGLLAAELLGLTALCADDATFVVRRTFEVTPGQTLKPSWSLGLFVGLASGTADGLAPRPTSGARAWRPLLIGAMTAAVVVLAPLVSRALAPMLRRSRSSRGS